jgi:hypothetical protein
MVETIVPGVAATSINSNIANTTEGTAYAIPYMKLGFNIAWQLVYSGSVSAVSVALQVSMDNSNWTTIDTSTNTSGEYRSLVGGMVAKFVRLYHTSRTGGTNVLGQILVM